MPNARRSRSPATKTITAALGVCLGGVVVGLLAASPASSLYDAFASPTSPLGRIFHLFVVQPGMGLFAAGVLLMATAPDRYLRFRRPTLEGAAWMALGPVLYWGATATVQFAADAVGWFSSGGHEGVPAWDVLLSHPQAIGIASAVLLAMAFAEEAVYRGLVHGVLEWRFGVGGRVALGALLFGLIHVFLSSGIASGVLTAVGGLVFAIAYERTDNLLVPIVIHALIWLRAPVPPPA